MSRSLMSFGVMLVITNLLIFHGRIALSLAGIGMLCVIFAVFMKLRAEKGKVGR